MLDFEESSEAMELIWNFPSLPLALAKILLKELFPQDGPGMERAWKAAWE